MHIKKIVLYNWPIYSPTRTGSAESLLGKRLYKGRNMQGKTNIKLR
jgi:hypothetical protein